MRIKNKLFPYPILNKNKLFTEYKNCEYELLCEYEQNEDFYILKNVSIKLDDPYMLTLLNIGKIKAVCIIECPRCMYRETFEISINPTDIKIPIENLAGKLEITSFIYANEVLEEFKSNNFLEEYGDYSFGIEKNCILAIDDGFNQRIDVDYEKDNVESSIFVLIPDLDPNCKSARWTYDENLIKISIPKLQYQKYDRIKYAKKFIKTFVSTFAVTPLSFILSDFIKSDRAIEDLEYHYKWFKAFTDTYERINGKSLTNEDFKSMDNLAIYMMIQKIFEYCVVNSVDDIFSSCIEGIGDISEEN